ncbi:hypothetical protein L596_021114 [Steinernema carpocapsae]|uniref:Uncharacterized protein n=1 Tax=Steinernema carpocapsae TaxID=34508 RepID=A0A4U5MVJ1_STECR|nr:hypothetical protein L596_021114 [Steinernema carpocapsae]
MGDTFALGRKAKVWTEERMQWPFRFLVGLEKINGLVWIGQRRGFLGKYRSFLGKYRPSSQPFAINVFNMQIGSLK